MTKPGESNKRTSFLVELLEHLGDDLSYALQRLDVVFGFGILLLQVAYSESHYKDWPARTYAP